MVDNECVISRFYEAFSRRDAEAMGRCYADDVVFSDPAFPRLEGDEARGMWRMLISGGEDLEVTFANVVNDGARGSASWEARYSFGPRKRKVHNKISAEFELRDGLIVRHTDTFPFYRWARMALGPAGALLGWTPWLQNKVRRQAAKQLERFMARASE